MSFFQLFFFETAPVVHAVDWLWTRDERETLRKARRRERDRVDRETSGEIVVSLVSYGDWVWDMVTWQLAHMGEPCRLCPAGGAGGVGICVSAHCAELVLCS